MVEIFRTDVIKKSQARKMLSLLHEQFPRFRMNFDLHDCDKILRVEGKNISVEAIIAFLHKQEHVCELLL